jgi:hypothetical protein
MNKELKKEVEGLQGAITAQAEKNPLPKGFKAMSKKGQPQVTIVNTNNGKEFDCPLYAYSGVRQALNSLL